MADGRVTKSALDAKAYRAALAASGVNLVWHFLLPLPIHLHFKWGEGWGEGRRQRRSKWLPLTLTLSP